MQDEEWRQRLRFTDADRADKTLEEQRVLMWMRIFYLNLLSDKRVRIGVYIGEQGPLRKKDWTVLFTALMKTAFQILQLRWWSKVCRLTRPVYELLLEWEGGGSTTENTGAAFLLRENLDDPVHIFHGVETFKSDFGVRSFGELFLVDEGLWKDISVAY